MTGPVFICDASGFLYPLSEAVRQWDGMLVHRSFVDKRNPADFLKVRPDGRPLPVSRPEPDDQFITVPITPADL